jgi:DNA-directed RNA polymerase subunit RPC12/RpoP
MRERKMIYLDDAVEALKNAILSWSDMPEWRDAKIMDALAEVPSVQSRKKGKWIEVHGFCTPGGDPVWKCSECGKGVHVCGVETYRTDISDGQWKACPGCGAEMIKD